MKMYSRIFSFSALILLVACAAPMTPQQEAFLEELANRPVTCELGNDCDEKWSRAIEWVTEHSDKKIKTLSDNLIATNMVYSGERYSGQRAQEFTVVKYAQGNHRYIINFDSYCEHGFACNPSGLKLKASFVTFVMGLPAGVTMPQPGVYQKTIKH